MSQPAIAETGRGTPVYLVPEGRKLALPSGLPDSAAAWAKATGFVGKSGTLCLVPGADNSLSCALFGTGKEAAPMDAGKLAGILPPGNWQLAGPIAEPYYAALGFLLGGYRFERYRKPKSKVPRLVLPKGIDQDALRHDAQAVFLVRDLVNLPANDLGPAALEDAVREVARRHGAKVAATRGDQLLTKNFPMIHAVGRASSQAPRLIDMKWGMQDHPKVTLVGKGVTFDSGGLNIKPGESMALMKKDMGGAANVLGLAERIMTARLPLRLRVIVGAVENAISGNAFRPGDILTSRKGLTVEIGNTDAEGRLVLGDALALADEEAPQYLIDMATLTGAARVALGPDLPALFTPSDSFAEALAAAARRVHDPMWRMPLWSGYDSNLSSGVADLCHISRGPFAGAITAALFLQRFVEKAGHWAHFDIFAWVSAAKPWAPVGGEAYAIRALYDVLASRYGR
jgi:leucyl aminopeptidase